VQKYPEVVPLELPRLDKDRPLTDSILDSAGQALGPLGS
jgi:hypothetical protein